MPDGSMEIDPQVLYDLANQHDRVHDDTIEWAKKPDTWLKTFPDSYGAIAHPVHKALEAYYDARERAGLALAREHKQTADDLRKAAREFEQADLDGGAGVRRIMNGPDSHGLPQTSPSLPNGASPNGHSPVNTSPSDNVPGGTQQPGSTPASDDSPVGVGPATSAPTTNGAAPAGPDGTGVSTPTSGTVPPGGPGGGPGGGPSGPSGPTVTPPGGVVSSVSAGPGGGPSGPGPDDRTSDRSSGVSAAGDLPPVPMATPFASAVAAAKDKEAAPAYVVGDAVNNDLVVARTLLGAVLAAVDSSVLGLHWAVAVMRGPGGVGVFITSNEGRGWFPAGLYLPREVSTPWLWDEMLGAGSAEAASPWEGVSDPARVLVEFGLAWGAKAGASLSAVVSSGSIDSGLRARFNDVAMEGMVAPSYDVDLRVATPDTADRLGLAGSVEALEQIAAVPDSALRARCVELAADAHAKVGRIRDLPADGAVARGVRDRILAAVQSGRDIPRSWWDELRDADDLLAASIMPRRVDVGRVEPGDLRVDDADGGLRTLVFERRCNELVLLLAEETTRQQLRDAVYAHEQIVKHPRFVEVPAAVSTAVDEVVARPVGAGQVSAPGVTAPGVTAGPPAGVVAPPSSSRPVDRPDATDPA
ncbi:type VII secretion target [Nocardia sp. NPDC050412]|uniref:type VII secretion target n=1 Tax=Nocardia sp. NPDC050412 TaxID=3364320 RepID=UPI0037AABB65